MPNLYIMEQRMLRIRQKGVYEWDIVKYTYYIYGGSGGSLFDGISPEKNIGEKHIRVGRMESAVRDLVRESGISDGYFKEYT